MIAAMIRDICSSIKMRAYSLDWALDQGGYAHNNSMSVMDLLEAEALLRNTADELQIKRERLLANDPDKRAA